jgi:ABC-type glycerol-3-phosphate transport system substrate-binding protein
MAWAAGERLDWVKRTIEQFNQTNAPHTAEHHLLAGAAGTVLPPLLAANTAPDVVLSGGQNLGIFAEGNNLVEVGEYVKRDKLDLNKWYLPLDGEGYVRSGKQYGMPFYVAHGIYLVNKTLFATHNVPLPNDNWTWNDLLDAARRLTQPGQSMGLFATTGFEFGWLNFLRSAGEDYVNKERTRTTINSAGAVTVFQWLVDLIQRHHVQLPIGDTTLGAYDVTRLWNEGKIGIRQSGTGAIGATLNARVPFEWDLFLTPKHPQSGRRAVSSNSDPMVMTKDARVPDVAWRLLLFTVSEFAQGYMGKVRANMPTLKSAAADPAGWLATPPANMRNSLEQMKHASPLLYHRNWPDWYDAITRRVTDAFTGQSGVKEALDDAARIGDGLLKGL